jgi:hypothetical protein
MDKGLVGGVVEETQATISGGEEGGEEPTGGWEFAVCSCEIAQKGTRGAEGCPRRAICESTLNGLLGHPQQSPFLRPFPHKRGRKLWGLPLITHRSCIVVGLGFAVPGPGVPGAPPFRPM